MKDFAQTADLYRVFGNPVHHSQSPWIHQAFARETGQQLVYDAYEAPLDNFAGALRAFITQGGLGANITVPFKEEAYALCDVLSPRARQAGAVNTLQMGKNGQLYGDNTDGVGLVRDLVQNQGVTLLGRRVLILGAGGASRGVVAPLLAEQPAQLHIANRTAAKAEALADHFQSLGSVSGGGWSSLDDCESQPTARYDVVINATAASLAGELPPLPDALLTPQAFAYDMMYGASPTVFLQWASTRNALTADGLGMLVEQAAEAFFLWRHQRPQTVPVIKTLRQRLSEGGH